ncbi:N-(5'-phosphoribosyl)anthranilate isomerase [Abditibacteriota bacterium]|nr:N-(5'-phosphoribosyl)anthranilate isomerase [Abditibacteriota bacterium]
MRVKICGTTSVHDARLALDAGTDFIGVIVAHPPSPRNVSPEVARTIRNLAPEKLVLLSVNQNEECLRELIRAIEPAVLQLHGDESPALVASLARQKIRVWKAIHGDASQLLELARQYSDAGAEAILVDARETQPDGIVYGGTGKVADWNGARALVNAGFRVVLAGGLTPDNVARAVEKVQPFAVDCVSGVEATKGVKDAGRVREFVRATRGEVSGLRL